MQYRLTRLDMIQQALATLGEAPAEKIARYVAEVFGIRIDTKFLPVYRASLADRQRQFPPPPAAPRLPASSVLPASESSPQQRVVQAQALALRLMEQHGLFDWSFRYNQRKRSLGLCVHQRRTIELSKPFVERNSWEEINDTILHEIAHALVGPSNGHNRIWKQKCREIGARPVRCGKADMPEGAWKSSCPRCRRRFHRYRRPKQIRGWYCQDCGPKLGKLVWQLDHLT